MDKIRIGMVLTQNLSQEWSLQLLARDFLLVNCVPDDALSLNEVDILLFDLISAGRFQHWLDLYRRQIQPDSPPVLLLIESERQCDDSIVAAFFDGVLQLKTPMAEIITQLQQWGALHSSARIWTQAALGQTGHPEHHNQPLPPSKILPHLLPCETRSALFSQFCEISNQGLFVCDSLGILRFVNSTLCQMTGYTHQELVGQSVQLLLPRLTHGDCFERFRQYVRQWSGWEGELAGFTRDGEHIRVWLNLQPGGELEEGGLKILLYTGILTDLSSTNKLEACILQLSQTDSLSDLNRILFEEKLTLDISRAQHQGHQIVLLHLELPEYRLLAEQLGHTLCGKMLSTQLARIETVVGQHGFCSRISASHYGVIISTPHLISSVQLLAQRLVGELSRLVQLEALEVSCPAVVGYTLFPDDARDAESLLRNADLAAKWCRENPPETVCRYTTSLLDFLEHDMSLLNDFKRGLEQRCFFLLYQPQIELRTKEVIGVEALVRWRRTPDSVVEPKEFIPLAESSGLIIPLTHQVLQIGCEQLNAWLTEGLQVRLCINISAVHFRHADLVDDIRSILTQYHIPAGYLELEVTETCLIKDINTATRTLQELKQLGVSISIDDFGTGYSSLGYMKRFPIDRLKIDQSFVHDIAVENTDAVIVRSIIALGHAMGYRVIAEGVETAEQLEYLRLMQCDEIQGFLLARPLLAEQIGETLGRLRASPMPEVPKPNARFLLLVDDERPILNALKRTLHNEGYQILLADDAEQAWYFLAHHPVGVMVCDNRMPGVSGIMLLREVKQRYPRVSRIMLSGYADLASLSDAINAGEIMRFIAKPWDDQELKMAIHDAFNRHEQEISVHGNLV